MSIIRLALSNYRKLLPKEQLQGLETVKPLYAIRKKFYIKLHIEEFYRRNID